MSKKLLIQISKIDYPRFYNLKKKSIFI